MPVFASADSDTDFESGVDPAHAHGDPSTERQDAERPRETLASRDSAARARRYEADAGDAAEASCAEEDQEKISATRKMSGRPPFPIQLGARVNLVMDGKKYPMTVLDVIRV
jgi:hypothetical protein